MTTEIKTLAPGESRWHDPKGNTLVKPKRPARPKKGQGSNGGRWHKWQFIFGKHIEDECYTRSDE